MKYKKLYLAANAWEAHLIQGLLELEAIETHLFGEVLSTAVGELPTDVIQVEIQVNEDKFSEAMRIITNYEQTLRAPVQDGKSWKCEECDSVNPETFEICWSCEANRLIVA